MRTSFYLKIKIFLIFLCGNEFVFKQKVHYINAITSCPAPYAIEKIWSVRDEIGVSLLIQTSLQQVHTHRKTLQF